MAAKMKMSSVKYIEEEKWSTHMVELDDETIYVTVTHNRDIVRNWISTVLFANYTERPDRLVVGVRFEWTRSSIRFQWRPCPCVDVLQLCAGRYCLIFQIRRAFANGNIPQELVDFMGHDSFIFAGIELDKFDEFLYRDYGIHFGPRVVDLNILYGIRRGKNTLLLRHKHGLRVLNNAVLRRDYETPVEVVTSDWFALLLQEQQILYASADVYCCFQIATILRAWSIK